MLNKIDNYVTKEEFTVEVEEEEGIIDHGINHQFVETLSMEEQSAFILMDI